MKETFQKSVILESLIRSFHCNKKTSDGGRQVATKETECQTEADSTNARTTELVRRVICNLRGFF